MPILVIRLPSSPAKYDQQDQDNLRRIIEQALSTSFEVGAHASTHFTGGSDEIALNNLAGALDIAKLEADPSATRLFLVSDTGVLSYNSLTVADLPSEIAYENEANTFTEPNVFQEQVTIDGLVIVDGKIPELEARMRFSRR